MIIGFLLGAAAMAAATFLLGEGRDELADSAEQRATSAPVPNLQPRTRGSSADSRQPESIEPTKPASPDVRSSEFASSAVIPGPMRTAEIPGATLGEKYDSNLALNRLVEAFRVDCLYGPGYGGNWSNGAASPHTAAWQGGLITFDTIDLVNGTALLKTSSGLTRTENGELEVRVQATQTGLHFTVFAPGGELIVASVYGMFDAQRKNAAVASFHGPHLGNESAQFYGACTTS